MDGSPNPPDRGERGPMAIAAAILGASLIISWGMGNGGPRYQIAGSADSVVRLDTDSGEMLACNAQQCVRVEGPTREKVLGPLKVVVDKTERREALPSPATGNSN
jgi:hypothetical protein